MDDVKARTLVLEEKFQHLKKLTLKNCKLEHISVPRLATLIKTLPAYKTNKDIRFLSDACEDLDTYGQHVEVFAALKFHWKYYFWHQLVDAVIERFDLKEAKEEMYAFKGHLHVFINEVRLLDFIKSEDKKRIRPPNYTELIADFNWSEDALLNMVEEFQYHYLDSYNLHQYVMVLGFVQHLDQFTVTWFIPDILTKTLKASLPYNVLEKFSVFSLTVGRDTVYIKHESKKEVKLAYSSQPCPICH